MSESNDNNNDNNSELMAECSDDENYSNFENNYRLVNGKRIWEPNGEQICRLYQQLESKGFIELDWQCPGRRSPSVNEIINAINHQKTNDINIDHETNTNTQKSNQLNEFDFETDFNTNHTSIAAKVNPRRRSNQGMKKSQTNLSKVMQDIKKYQMIDNQTKKLSLQTISATFTPNTSPINSISINSSNNYSTSQSSTDNSQYN